jgi:hypothetical protein
MMTLGNLTIFFAYFQIFDRLKNNYKISHIFITTLFVAQRQGISPEIIILNY